MKRLFILAAIPFFFAACGNDQAKIEELEQKLDQQERAHQAEKQADLEQELADKEAELNRLKDGGQSAKRNADQNYYAKGCGRFTMASERHLTEEDVAYLSPRDLKIMRNEIFARYGYIFKTQEMKDYFSRQSWYRPLFDDVNNRLTKLEKENAEYIKMFE